VPAGQQQVTSVVHGGGVQRQMGMSAEAQAEIDKQRAEDLARENTTNSQISDEQALGERLGNLLAAKHTVDLIGDDDDRDPIEHVEKRAKRAKDDEDFRHDIIHLVCDFVCGAQAPPSKNPTQYMERGLAEKMAVYQRQMFDEVRSGGEGIDAGVKMNEPEVITFWEHDMFRPSAENMELRVFVIQALVACRETGKSAMMTLNVYVNHDLSSGFTLDHVHMIHEQWLKGEWKQQALDHYAKRTDGKAEDRTTMIEGEEDWQALKRSGLGSNSVMSNEEEHAKNTEADDAAMFNPDAAAGSTSNVLSNVTKDGHAGTRQSGTKQSTKTSTITEDK